MSSGEVNIGWGEWYRVETEYCMESEYRVRRVNIAWRVNVGWGEWISEGESEYREGRMNIEKGEGISGEESEYREGRVNIGKGEWILGREWISSGESEYHGEGEYRVGRVNIGSGEWLYILSGGEVFWFPLVHSSHAHSVTKDPTKKSFNLLLYMFSLWFLSDALWNSRKLLKLYSYT